MWYLEDNTLQIIGIVLAGSYLVYMLINDLKKKKDKEK